MKFFLVRDKRYSELISSYCDLEKGPWVAGGSVRKVFQGKPWHTQDIDFFFRSPNQFSRMRERIKEFGEIDPYVHETKNACSYKIITEPDIVYKPQLGSRLKPEKKPDPEKIIRIQLVCNRWYNSAGHVISDFDLSLCQFITDGNIIVATNNAIADTVSKTISTTADSNAKINPNRLIKYAAYGFNPDPELFLSCIRRTMTEGVSDDSY